MLKSYFKSTFRKLVKDKQYTFINIIGLSTGFALFLIIALYIQRELAVDAHHQNADNVYRVNTESTSEDGNTNAYALSYHPMATAMTQEIPEVASATSFFAPAAQLSFRAGDNLISVDEIYYTDQSFFNVFTLDWEQKGELLNEPNTVVISDELAVRYFGNQNPMGQSLVYENQGLRHSLTVTGVYRQTNLPSHFSYDMLINHDAGVNFWKSGLDGNWGLLFVYTYFRTEGTVAKSVLDQKINGLRTKYQEGRDGLNYKAQNLRDVYWDDGNQYEPGTNGNYAYIYVFGAFGLTVLILALVNFVNLMTARSIRRSKEVAVRKIVGASRGGLIMQFLTESVVLSALAMMLGAVAVERLIGPINSSLDLGLSFSIFSNHVLLTLIVTMPLLIGLFSGIYPALMLSSLSAGHLIQQRTRWNISHDQLRQGLLVFQFAISVLVISGVMVIGRQMDFIKSEGLGFTSDPVIVLPRISNESNYLMRQELAATPSVKGIASLSSIPGYRSPRQRNVKEAGTEGEGIRMNGIWVSEQYADILELDFVAGRNFTLEDQENAMVLNEKAVADLGLSPEEVVGRQLVMTGRNGFGDTQYIIIGVTKDYYYQSLYERVEPLFLMNNSKSRSGGDASIVQLSGGNIEEGLTQLAAVWTDIEKGEGFDYYFLDDAVNEVYQREVKLSNTVNYVSAISILICLLGLYGQVSLNLQSRKKEIGIRKVLGASTDTIIRLFAKRYVWMIGLSILIGLPVSYRLLQLWLANFEYSISYSFPLYFLVGICLMIASLVLIGIQSQIASRMNPVDTLRNE
ncbi:MAG: FtsX-like permease family protein [Roseivirga sp.]|nr:FtsX-like permease family protein [Roseivirga sp.]